MKKMSLVLLVSAFAAASAFAQTAGVSESTDPAKAAAVERHAQELRATQAGDTMAKEPTSAGKKQHAKHHHAKKKGSAAAKAASK